MAVDQRFKVFRRGAETRAVILRLKLEEYAEIEAIADQADIGVATVCKQLIWQALSRGVVVVEREQQLADRPQQQAPQPQSEESANESSGENELPDSEPA